MFIDYVKIYNKIIFNSLDLVETAYTYSEDIILNDKDWVEASLSTTVPSVDDLMDFISYFISTPVCVLLEIFIFFSKSGIPG